MSKTLDLTKYNRPITYEIKMTFTLVPDSLVGTGNKNSVRVFFDTSSAKVEDKSGVPIAIVMEKAKYLAIAIVSRRTGMPFDSLKARALGVGLVVVSTISGKDFTKDPIVEQ